jgi:hypothetical protein
MTDNLDTRDITLKIKNMYILKLNDIVSNMVELFDTLEDTDNDKLKTIVNLEHYKFNQIDATLELLKDQTNTLQKNIKNIKNINDSTVKSKTISDTHFNSITKNELDILFPIMYGLSLTNNQTPINDNCS